MSFDLFEIDMKTVLKWAGLAFNETTKKKMDKQDEKTHRRILAMLESEEDLKKEWNISG